ncbi:SRPBCC domain-containing protein [Chitinophaga sp. MM2321]|uniref:SRPBCC family protein n=1 Tax=Chitinophaga sp. MM2321 TaxID=3137178 RepID=UPI0032D580D7
MERAIKHTWFYSHPPETVWDYLTKPELLSQWLMESNFQPIVGQKFQFNTKPKIKFGFDGRIYCEVLELIPYKRLSYSWKGGIGKENVTLDSIVTWTLTQKDNGTQLTLEHSGFRGMKNFISYLVMNKGWAKIGKRLGERINTYRHDTTNT